MKHVLTFLEPAHAQVQAAFAASEIETVAFGFAGRLGGDRRRGLIIDRVELVPDDAYLVRQPYRFRVDSSYVAGLALQAADSGRSLLLMHSHPGGAIADFSPSDHRLHERLVPNFLGLLPAPVGSAVWSAAGWSGRLWWQPGEGEEIDLVRIAGRALDVRDLGTQSRASDDPWDRQIRAFGKPVQRRLAALRVGIIGLGGTGSIAAEWLAHLGVRDFVFVDPQVLDQSNLSRVIGSRPGDVRTVPALLKAVSAARMVTTIAPDAQVAVYDEDVVNCVPLHALREVDVVLLCTDGHASRAAVNPLAFQYGVPLLDLGTLLRADSGAVSGAFAEMRLVAPETACLRCQGAIDPDRVTDELLPLVQRRLREQFGYAPGLRMPEPSVLPLNGLAVSLGLLRLLDLLQPWLDWDDRLTVEAKQLWLRVTRDARIDGCEICGEGGVRGRGDDVPLNCRSRGSTT